MKQIAVLNEFSIEAINDAVQKLDSFDHLIVNGLNAFQLNEIEKIMPELFSAISEKIRSGKWFPFAGMWCEFDRKISDENLTRNVLYSARYFKEKFGKSYRLFSADRIYTAALPQITYTARYDVCYIRSEKGSYWLDGADGTRMYVTGDIETVDVNDIDDDFIKENEFTSVEDEIISRFSLPMNIGSVKLPCERSCADAEEKLLLDAEKITVQSGENFNEKIKDLWLEIFLGNSVANEAKEMIAGRDIDSDFIKINSDKIEIVAMKFAEDNSGDVVIRIKETAGIEQSLFVICDSLDAGFRCEAAPHELQTFRIDKDGFVKEIFMCE